MSELDDRIATQLTGLWWIAEATRFNDLRAVKAEIAAVSERLVDVFGRLTATMATLDALSARVAALEAQPRIVTAGSQDDDRASPAPPAPMPFAADTMLHEGIKASPEQPSPHDPTFVERVRYAINTTSQENVSDTPDFILADFVTEMLDALNSTINRRRQWLGTHEDRQRGERKEQGKDVGRQEPSGTREAAEVPSSGVAPASPAPPAPLVDRMISAWMNTTGPNHAAMRAALLVAAEDLLRPVTGPEWAGAIKETPDGSWRVVVNYVLRARLTAAREACR